MIRSLTLEGYRGFRRFEMHELGRINLIVGTNNSGKTSILEAVNLLAAEGDYSKLWSTLRRRGENVDDREIRRVNGRQGDVRRLFHGHALMIGSSFSITGQTDAARLSLIAKILMGGEVQPSHRKLFEFDEPGTEAESDILQSSMLELNWDGQSESKAMIEVSGRGGISMDGQSTGLLRAKNAKPNLFISASSLSPEAVVELFEEIVLTPDEELVVEALRIIEPSIQRIASTGTERWRDGRSPGRGGLLVRCEGINDRIPIGSMGDGIWRLLGLALAMVRTGGGVLLVDEIDTGLHYSVMEDMWRLIDRTARRLNIQVFATTHSRDCYESLAAIARDDVSNGSEATIQRVERGKEQSVVYTEQEIVAAATRGMEVR